MSYSEKLKDPRWQKKRLMIMQRDNFTCQWCMDDKSTLNVHHLIYEGDNPWDTSSEYLLTICENCHKADHKEREFAEMYLIQELKKSGFSTICLYTLAMDEPLKNKIKQDHLKEYIEYKKSK